MSVPVALAPNSAPMDNGDHAMAKSPPQRSTDAATKMPTATVHPTKAVLAPMVQPSPAVPIPGPVWLVTKPATMDNGVSAMDKLPQLPKYATAKTTTVMAESTKEPVEGPVPMAQVHVSASEPIFATMGR